MILGGQSELLSIANHDDLIHTPCKHMLNTHAINKATYMWHTHTTCCAH